MRITSKATTINTLWKHNSYTAQRTMLQRTALARGFVVVRNGK